MDTVKESYFSDFEDIADGSIGSFARLREKLAKVWEEIPEAYRDLAMCHIELDCGCYDDSPSITTEVFHIRDKTEEEIKEEQASRRWRRVPSVWRGR